MESIVTAPEELIEQIRRALLLEINAEPADCTGLQARHGRVWSPTALAKEFEVLAFKAPFVVVRRKADQQLGSLLFQHHPRYYFGFQEDRPTPGH